MALAHTILESSPEYLRKLFDVNIISHFYTLQAFLPDMISRKKGHIVTTASMASFVTCAGLADYAATKAALHEGLGQELKHRYSAPEIKTSIVHPIYVRTPLVTSYADSLKRSGAVQIQPETVANAIIKQITSGESGQITLPNWMGTFSGTRGFPWWFQELARDSTKNDVERE
jgi:short-subunit dehydrogenase